MDTAYRNNGSHYGHSMSHVQKEKKIISFVPFDIPQHEDILYFSLQVLHAILYQD